MSLFASSSFPCFINFPNLLINQNSKLIQNSKRITILRNNCFKFTATKITEKSQLLNRISFDNYTTHIKKKIPKKAVKKIVDKSEKKIDTIHTNLVKKNVKSENQLKVLPGQMTEKDEMEAWNRYNKAIEDQKLSLAPQIKMPPVDLGLDPENVAILNTPQDQTIEKYLELKDYSQEDMENLKHDKSNPIKPGTPEWDKDELAAQRIQTILEMPTQGPGMYMIKRSTNLWTDEEEEYFEKYPRTPKNYNIFIWSLSKSGKYEKALHAFEQMKLNDLIPGVQIYTSLLQGCIYNKDVKECERLFFELLRNGLEPDLWVFSAMMETYISAGDLDGAFALYDQLKTYKLKPNVVIFTSLIKGCVKDKDLDRAWKVFHHMRTWHCEPDEITMALMIHVSALKSEAEKALNLLEEMKSMQIRPSVVAYDSALFACVRRRDFYKDAFELLRTMKTEGLSPTKQNLDKLLAVAGKGGDISTAELIFDEILSRPDKQTEHTYAFMIEAYAMGHRTQVQNSKNNIEKARIVFDRMIEAGIKPTNLSLNMMLNVFTFHSLLSNALEWKKSLKEVYNVEPDVYSYNSLIEMYARNRRMELSLDNFVLMKAEGLVPNFTTYSMLIEGCTRNHLYNTGIKLLREMKAKNIDIKPEHTFIINFRRLLIRTPDLVREIDRLTGKAYRYIMPWRRSGNMKKITYMRELTKEEMKRSPLYG